MENELLIHLLDEYKAMLIAENEYIKTERLKQFSEDVNNYEQLKNRPTQAELNRVGIMIRQKSKEYENFHNRNSWKV